MRKTLVPLLLLLVAATGCRGNDAKDLSPRAGAKGSTGTRGPDPVLIRIPRGGGTVRAYIYPKLDSVAWSGTGTSIEQVLGFDPEWGALAVIDRTGNPARIDFRSGESGAASKAHLTSLSSTNGADIYGVDSKGKIVRMTRSGGWTFAPPAGARAVFPQLDGAIIVAAQRGDETVLWKLRPPESKILDSVMLQVPLRGVRMQAGDRIYIGTDGGLVGVKTRDLSVVAPIDLDGKVVAVAPTPSGDRVYVATSGARGVSIIDRYTERRAGEIELPGSVSELRMDPLGRYVIARPMHGDSAWVIAVATDRVVGTVQTRWTADLPAPAPDGAIAVNTGRDVVFVDGETLQPVRTVVGGASDYWYFTFWNGFRPRAAGLDQPVSFARDDSVAGADSAGVADTARVATGGDSAAPAAMPQPSPSPAPVPAPAPAPAAAPGHAAPAHAAPATQAPAPAHAAATVTPAAPVQPVKPPQPTVHGFSVSFATLLNEAKAREMAASISVGNTKARVIPVQRAGTMVYRVILGPYPTHVAAEEAGKASKRNFWVYAEEQ